MNMPRFGWPILAAFVMGLVGAWCIGRWGPAQVAPRTVYVNRPPEQVYRDRPVVRTKLVDRIIYRTVKPDTILISPPHTVDTLVVNFCQGTRASDTTTVKPQLALTAASVGRSDLRLYGFTNTGQAYAGHWNVKPPYEFTTDGDTVRLSQKRLRFHLPSLASVGECMLIGGAAGYVGMRLGR